jgi:hypothetical protein
MQGDACGLCEACQRMWHHLGTQLADFLALQPEVDDAVGATGDVDYGPGEGFVERCVAATESDERKAKAEGASKSGAEGKKGIFCGVVIVDWRKEVNI